MGMVLCMHFITMNVSVVFPILAIERVGLYIDWVVLALLKGWSCCVSRTILMLNAFITVCSLFVWQIGLHRVSLIRCRNSAGYLYVLLNNISVSFSKALFSPQQTLYAFLVECSPFSAYLSNQFKLLVNKPVRVYTAILYSYTSIALFLHNHIK